MSRGGAEHHGADLDRMDPRMAIELDGERK